VQFFFFLTQKSETRAMTRKAAVHVVPQAAVRGSHEVQGKWADVFILGPGTTGTGALPNCPYGHAVSDGIIEE